MFSLVPINYDDFKSYEEDVKNYDDAKVDRRPPKRQRPRIRK